VIIYYHNLVRLNHDDEEEEEEEVKNDKVKKNRKRHQINHYKALYIQTGPLSVKSGTKTIRYV
jgi:hypothetical protein